MAQVPPPRENVPIYNSLNYFSANTTSLASKLDYPTAQGLETFPNGIQFGDGTVQSTAVQPADISGATNPLTDNLNAADYDITNVDDLQVSTLNLNSQGGALSAINVSANIDMGGNAITNVANIAGSSNAATQQYVLDEVAEWSQYPALASNPVNANSQRVINVADPSNNTDAVNKQYLETYVPSNYLAGWSEYPAKSGYPINANLQRVTMVANPSANEDAVNLQYFNNYLSSPNLFQPMFWSSQLQKTNQYAFTYTVTPQISFSLKSGASPGSFDFLLAEMNFKLTVRCEVWLSFSGGNATSGYVNLPNSSMSAYFTVWPGRMYYAGVWSGVSSNQCYLFKNSGGTSATLQSTYANYNSIPSATVGVIRNQGTYFNTNSAIGVQDNVYCYGTNNTLAFVCQNPYITNNPSQTVDYFYTVECEMLNVNAQFNDQFAVSVNTGGQSGVVKNNFLPFLSSL